MLTRIVSFQELIEVGRWRANLHVHTNNEMKSSKYDMVPLGDVVKESTAAAEPQSQGGEFYYIGLENVTPITGDPMNISLVGPEEVRSRSKMFRKGNILYARLRPYLRKVLLVEEPFEFGLCSTEFIILDVDPSVVLPQYLRDLLSSESVTSYLSRLQGGAALPRVSSKDLLAMEIPVPPQRVQMRIVEELERIKEKRHQLMDELEVLKEDQQELIKKVF
ncbi:MAG: hypothetical protein GX945_12630 [Lentisphaerae bacterium]|jgi:restriction endonuclease S subunit|nr:hypothetical protein [Lentisphaerota bacterium]